jgi:3-oxoacyl-[acyl-carrier protein] reductase
MTLEGRTALVTGASRGLGRAIALRLAQAGAAVGVNYLEQAEAAAAVVGEIRAHGGRALAAKADVAEPAQVRDMVARVTVELGDVDILVNNAGVSRPGDLTDFDLAQLDGMRRVNVDGVVAVTRAVVERTRRFALELGPHGITVNAVAPGFILTDMARAGRTEADFAAIAAKAMVRRVGRPEDIANAVAFLAAPESGFVTAQVLTVDGGRMDYIGHP